MIFLINRWNCNDNGQQSHFGKQGNLRSRGRLIYQWHFLPEPNGNFFQIDDTEDADILDSILDRFPPPGVQVFSTEGNLITIF